MFRVNPGRPILYVDAQLLVRTSSKGASVRSYNSCTKRTTQMPDTVLIVDDHAMVLTTLVETLARAGFEVLPASSGEEALEIASNVHSRIDLLVCDILLPGMQGTE